MAERVPAEVFPPGEFVKDELEARGWSQNDLAEILGRPPRLISEIIGAKRAVTPETARGLAAAFGTDAQLWMNLESAYQLSRVAQPTDIVSRRARLYELVPMKEMIRRHWIEASESIDVLEQRVMAFLRVTSLDEPIRFKGAARASIEPTPAQCAWLARARQLAGLVHVEKFTKSSVESACEKLRPLFLSVEEARHVPRILADAGIRFVIVEALPNTRIDGACFWLNDKSPVIALSLRFDRIDAFWFTLLHELAHVRNGDGKTDDSSSLDVDLVGEQAERTENKPESERKADEFASETLVAERQIKDFVARVRPLYSKLKIAGFASRLHVHPGVVVGRLQFMHEIPYSHSREMLAKVRGVITPVALTDGWGSLVALKAEESQR